MTLATSPINPQTLNNYPPAIAAALATLSTQVLADLTALLGGVAGGTAAFKARAVIAQIAPYTSAKGVLTASANGALGPPDGVAVGVGDVVFLPAAIANIVQNSDAGPYVVTAVGSGGAPFVLTRPPWWATGTLAQPGQSIDIGGEGAHWGGNTWKVYAAEGATVIDANDLTFYPRKDFATSQAAVAGVTPIAGGSTMYVAPTANVIPVLNTNATAAGTWRISTQTPGYPGTSSVRATSTAPTETSTVNFFVLNF